MKVKDYCQIFNKKNKFFIKNISYVFSGSILSNILSLVNTFLILKALGVEKNGIIFLGLSYIGLFNALFNFQSYEAIIKFLPKSFLENDYKKIKNYILLGFYLDIFTAILAFFFSYLLIKPIGNYMQWNQEIINYIKILTFSILFTLTGTCNGILRIFSKFKEFSFINIIKNIFLTITSTLGLYMNSEIGYFIINELLSSFLTMNFMFFFAFKTLKEKKINIFFKKVKLDKEFIEFVLYSNLNIVLDLPIFHLTTFIINKYIGISEITLYKILEKIGSILKQIANVLLQVVIPEISKAIAENKMKKVKSWALRIGMFFFSMGLLFLLFVILTKEYWLKYFIPNYLEHIYTIYLYILYISITLAFIFQHPIFIYSGNIKKNIPILLIANTIYLITIIVIIKKIGILGVVISLIVQSGIVFSLKGIILFKDKKI